MAWIKIAKTSEIPNNKGKEVNVNGNRVAVFHSNGKYYALEALCRHQDGSLAPGKIDGEVVECPLHFWHYNIRLVFGYNFVQGLAVEHANNLALVCHLLGRRVIVGIHGNNKMT